MSTSSKGTALITGASTGIGAVYADRLAKRGYDLILVARDEARLNALAERLRAEAGVKVEVMRADLTDKADLKAVEERLAPTGHYPLVNNAGVAGANDFATADPDAFDKMIQLNVTAVTRLAAPPPRNFVPRDSGTIINLASVVGLMPELGMPVYGATKAFVTYLTQGLRVSSPTQPCACRRCCPAPRAPRSGNALGQGRQRAGSQHGHGRR
jgi:short-subunit dehydrogenase